MRDNTAIQVVEIVSAVLPDSILNAVIAVAGIAVSEHTHLPHVLLHVQAALVGKPLQAAGVLRPPIVTLQQRPPQQQPRPPRQLLRMSSALLASIVLEVIQARVFLAVLVHTKARQVKPVVQIVVMVTTVRILA
jgi:hypothetical protein